MVFFPSAPAGTSPTGDKAKARGQRTRFQVESAADEADSGSEAPDVVPQFAGMDKMPTMPRSHTPRRPSGRAKSNLGSRTNSMPEVLPAPNRTPATTAPLPCSAGLENTELSPHGRGQNAALTTSRVFPNLAVAGAAGIVPHASTTGTAVSGEAQHHKPWVAWVLEVQQWTARPAPPSDVAYIPHRRFREPYGNVGMGRLGLPRQLPGEVSIL